MKKSSQKAKLTLLAFILMLLVGVGNLLWLLLKNNFYASSSQDAASGGYLTLIATILFVVSSLVGIVIVLSDLRGKS